MQEDRGETTSTSDHDVYPVALFTPEGEEIPEVGVDVPAGTSEGTIIYTKTLESIKASRSQDIRIDLTHVATPCRFRFISCAAFLQALPAAKYAAISHVWASAPPKDGILTERGSFLVECENRNDGGPISIDVLHYTCLAALHEGAPYVWLDRLCVLQRRRRDENISADKKWQITRMHEIYQHSRVSLVLTAGLRRFPDRYEATGWVDRAWTFQEAMVAPEAKVLFVAYPASAARGSSPPTPTVRMLSIAAYFEMQRSGDDGRGLTLERQQQFVEALRARAQFRSAETREVLTRYRTIWRFVQWRSSARQADVVFSVMAMLGVRLDPAKFKPDDRFEATLALVQEMLRNDPARNSYVKIPLWRAIDKMLVEEDCKKRGLPIYNVHDYMKRLPSIIPNIRELESVLDRKLVQGFSATTQRRFANAEGDLEYDELKIPLTMVDQILNGELESNHVPFTTPHVAIGLCKTLSLSQLISNGDAYPMPKNDCIFGWCIQDALWVQTRRGAVNTGVSDTKVRKGSRMVPIPIITFWKFASPGPSIGERV